MGLGLLLYALSSTAKTSSESEDGKVTISGYVKDSKSGETLIGATIAVKEKGTGTQSNSYGFYSISLPPGNYTLVYSYLGYQSITKTVDLSKSIKLDIELSETGKQLDEVVITGERPDKNVKSMEMSVAKLDISTIKKIPALLGEVDVIRSILLLPGISTVGEGASGYNARGGGVDQNLALIDEAPVYNTSHLFGLFSVYNPDAVKDVKLIKGGIPAQYGGRLSSILDVKLKEGNSKKLGIAGGVGLIFSRLTVEGPFDTSGKGSFIVSGRRSYGDIFLALAPQRDLRESILNFWDFSAKANYTLGAKDKIYLSGYMGRDNFGFSSIFGFNWGNNTATLRWNHLFNDKLFLNTTAVYSKYDYSLKNEEGNDGFFWNSSLINYQIKPEFTWYANDKNTVTFGAQSILYEFKPGNTIGRSRGEERRFGLPSKWAFEHAAFIGNEQILTSRLSAQYGLRLSYFQYMGEGRKYEYQQPATPGQRALPVDPAGQRFNQWEVIQGYFNPEPRFSLKYETGERSSIKASYNRMVQYIHLISNSTAAAPLDVWTPSTNNIKPQKADQVALGYFQNFGKKSDNDYELSVEGFYKHFQNQIDYIDGADLLLNQYLEGELLSGPGRAYGLEFYLRKNSGKFTGWVSYTLSRSERQVNGINNGDWYPARFDRTHNLSFVGSYQFTPKTTLSGTWTLQSGIPNTLPSSRFDFQGIVLPYIAGNARNNFRVPWYNRLDLSLTIEGKQHTGEKWYHNWSSEWVFSCYNVMGINNPFSIYSEVNPDNKRETRIVKFMVFATPIPSVSYNFKF